MAHFVQTIFADTGEIFLALRTYERKLFDSDGLLNAAFSSFEVIIYCLFIMYYVLFINPGDGMMCSDVLYGFIRLYTALYGFTRPYTALLMCSDVLWCALMCSDVL